jgi:hypothetical protein
MCVLCKYVRPMLNVDTVFAQRTANQWKRLACSLQITPEQYPRSRLKKPNNRIQICARSPRTAWRWRGLARQFVIHSSGRSLPPPPGTGTGTTPYVPRIRNRKRDPVEASTSGPPRSPTATLPPRRPPAAQHGRAGTTPHHTTPPWSEGGTAVPPVAGRFTIPPP